MPDLYARPRSLRRTRWYDEVIVDVYTRGAGRRERDAAYVLGHRVRVPRGASDAQVLALAAAEVTRLELLALPDDGPDEPLTKRPSVTQARVDRRTGERWADAAAGAVASATGRER